MQATANDLSSLWWSSWSAPMRAACHWMQREPPRVIRPDVIPAAPRGIRPLCVQRWAGQALVDRIAWWRAHPDAWPYRYTAITAPPWESGRPIVPYDWRGFGKLSDATMRWYWRMDTERLLRIAEAPPALVGEEVWARASLDTCEHLAQVYDELKRRHKAKKARAIVRKELRAFVTWEKYHKAA